MKVWVILAMHKGRPTSIGVFKIRSVANEAYVKAVEYFGKNTVMQEFDI